MLSKPLRFSNISSFIAVSKMFKKAATQDDAEKTGFERRCLFEIRRIVGFNPGWDYARISIFVAVPPGNMGIIC